MKKYYIEQNQVLILHETFEQACLIGDLETIKLLSLTEDNLLSGAALSFAAETSQLDIIIYLVENNSIVLSDIYHPLNISAAIGNIDAVKYLLQQGYGIHLNSDHTLIYSIHQGHFDIVKLLVEQGAKINNNVLNVAISFGHFTILSYLMKQPSILQNFIFDEQFLASALMSSNVDIISFCVEQYLQSGGTLNKIQKQISNGNMQHILKPIVSQWWNSFLLHKKIDTELDFTLTAENKKNKI